VGAPHVVLADSVTSAMFNMAARTKADKTMIEFWDRNEMLALRLLIAVRNISKY
jgi:hypothetical protein